MGDVTWVVYQEWLDYVHRPRYNKVAVRGGLCEERKLLLVPDVVGAFCHQKLHAGCRIGRCPFVYSVLPDFEVSVLFLVAGPGARFRKMFV